VKEKLLQILDDNGYVSDVFIIKNGNFISLFGCVDKEKPFNLNLKEAIDYLQSIYPGAFIDRHFFVPAGYQEMKELVAE
jgi:ribosomal protein S8